MNDKYDDQAEQLLPCEYGQVDESCDIKVANCCYSCAHRPPIAARLRHDGQLIDDMANQLIVTKKDIVTALAAHDRILLLLDRLEAKLNQ